VLGYAWCRGNEIERGLEVLVPSIEMQRAGNYVVGELSFAHYLAEGYLLGGKYQKARQTATDFMKLADKCEARWYMGTSYRLIGEIALATNPDEAAPNFEKTIPIFEEIKAENDLALAYSGMGRYHKQQGETEQAREYLTKALEIFERLGTLIEPDKVRKELAEVG
jgi:tetratricopeptide (TPR) repeat protein